MVPSLEANLRMTRQRLAEYYQYTMNLEFIRCSLQTQIFAADRRAAELESSLLEQQTLTDRLQAREMELQNEVYALQTQNRDCASRLEEAENRILETTTLCLKEHERAEGLQKNLDLVTTPQNKLRNFDRPHSAQPSSANKKTLRRANKNLNVSAC